MNDQLLLKASYNPFAFNEDGGMNIIEPDEDDDIIFVQKNQPTN